MWRLFITLYVLMLMFFVFYDSLIYAYVENFHEELLIEDQSKDYTSWMLALEHFTKDASFDELKEIFVGTSEGANYPIVVLSPAEFEQTYPYAVSQFNAHNMFFLDVEEGEFLYAMTNGRAILKAGPMETISELEAIANSAYTASLLALTLVIVAWTISLWRKLVGLERKLIEFGEGDLTARASEKYGMRLGRLNTTFNSMAEKIRQLLLQNRQLIRAVSHELRAPISRLRCQVELLDSGADRAQNAIYLEDMSSDMAELENLVDEILNYSRMEASDSIDADIKEVKIKPVLVELLNVLNRDSRGDIALVCDPHVCAKIDVKHFRRAIGNLVQNAERYCKDTVQVSVDIDTKNTLVTIHVDDDGPGIPVDERIRIFEPFARLDQSRTRDSGGYGLGLAIVRQIAILHKGNVEISTSPLEGARLSLELPACTSKPTSD